MTSGHEAYKILQLIPLSDDRAIFDVITNRRWSSRFVNFAVSSNSSSSSSSGPLRVHIVAETDGTGEAKNAAVIIDLVGNMNKAGHSGILYASPNVDSDIVTPPVLRTITGSKKPTRTLINTGQRRILLTRWAWWADNLYSKLIQRRRTICNAPYIVIGTFRILAIPELPQFLHPSAS
jgi:hypothetical protein